MSQVWRVLSTGNGRLAPTLALLLALVTWVAPALAAAKIERVVSPGGIEAWLVRDATVPLVAVEFAFQGGSSQDPERQARRRQHDHGAARRGRR